MSASFTSPVESPAASVFLQVEELRRTRYGWAPRKCARCRAVRSEMIVRFWLELELGAGQYVTVCRACLTEPELEAWRNGDIYRSTAPAPGPADARRRLRAQVDS